MLIDFSNIDELKTYKLMSATIVPRPIAWIGTQSGGIVNLAPFSYFAPLSSKPPVVIVSIGHKDDGTKKDTLANLLNGSHAVINFVDIAFMNEMLESANPLPKNQSEIDAYNIPTKRVLSGFPPMVDGVKAALFCKFIKTVEIEGSETIPLILEILHAFYDDSCINAKFDVMLDNVGRVGKHFIGCDDLIE